MPDLAWSEVVLRLALAAALGGAIGAERELRDREAGFRTHILVAVGAALFTLVSAYAWTDWAFSTRSGLVFDPTRIAAQVVTGIGFLGAGAIIRQGISVRGLTTAATLWAVAAIGMAAGTGYYVAAVATTAIVLVSLWPLRALAHRVFTRLRPDDARLVVRLTPGASIAPLVDELERAGVQVDAVQLEDADGPRSVSLDVELPPDSSPAALVDRLGSLDGVQEVQWTA